LAQFPRRRYTEGFTPIVQLKRFSQLLGGPMVYMKRDDLLGLTCGGNKARKLEFVVADALDKHCDTLITAGAIQSNHCRLTLSAARKEGLKCCLILEERVPGTYDPSATGNNLLYKLLKADEIHVARAGCDEESEMHKMAEKVKDKGGKPYIIDGSNASALSALGYVAGADEILAQLFEKGLVINTMVCASGSGGTHGGLLTGLFATNTKIPVMGINVRRNKSLQEEKVYDVVKRTVELLGINSNPPRDMVLCFDDYYSPGYSEMNPGTIEAIKLLSETEGILLDPVYTGKAMAGLIDLIRKNYFKKKSNVLFIHTGGSPALYAYSKYFV
jgi:D-cysteine desulfhydrase